MQSSLPQNYTKLPKKKKKSEVRAAAGARPPVWTGSLCCPWPWRAQEKQPPARQAQGGSPSVPRGHGPCRGTGAHRFWLYCTFWVRSTFRTTKSCTWQREKGSRTSRLPVLLDHFRMPMRA